MAFYFDDLLTAGDAEQAVRCKFSPVGFRSGSAFSDYSASNKSETSSMHSQVPLRGGSRNKLMKNNARFSTPVLCATWPCKAPRVPQYQYRYTYEVPYSQQSRTFYSSSYSL